MTIIYEEASPQGDIIRQIYEFEGSIFNFEIIEGNRYNSQLTPLGYYNFVFRPRDSSVVLTTTLPLEEIFLLYDAARIILESDDIPLNARVLSNTIINNLRQIDIDIIHIQPNIVSRGASVILPILALCIMLGYFKKRKQKPLI
ncbi:MAG: hypothetical protein FWC69_01220 [Defluviitaleaceae bacterium]|nr:hypothetical protein [Defluviitaleaceae bacterium]